MEKWKKIIKNPWKKGNFVCKIHGKVEIFALKVVEKRKKRAENPWKNGKECYKLDL